MHRERGARGGSWNGQIFLSCESPGFPIPDPLPQSCRARTADGGVRERGKPLAAYLNIVYRNRLRESLRRACAVQGTAS